MIFNKDDNGSRELRELTGNYYANNDFNKIIILSWQQRKFPH